MTESSQSEKGKLGMLNSCKEGHMHEIKELRYYSKKIISVEWQRIMQHMQQPHICYLYLHCISEFVKSIYTF